MNEVLLRRFEAPDEVREFPNGRLELVTIAGMTIGRATYQPGWRWSADIGAATGDAYCSIEHLGVVISGRLTTQMKDGTFYHLTPGMVFYIPPEPHDAWVTSDEPYMSLHIMGAAEYARTP